MLRKLFTMTCKISYQDAIQYIYGHLSFFFSLWQLYASTIAGCSFGYALIPLFFEYTAELAYPIDEGLLGGFLTCFNNVFGCIFLFLFFIPMESMAWMNYCLVASSLIPIPLVLLTKESYRRLDVDMPGESITVAPSEPPYSILEN